MMSPQCLGKMMHLLMQFPILPREQVEHTFRSSIRFNLVHFYILCFVISFSCVIIWQYSSFQIDVIIRNMPFITSPLTSSFMSSSSSVMTSKLHHPQRLDGKMPHSKKRVAFSSLHYGGNRDDSSTMTLSTASTSLSDSSSTQSPLHTISEDEYSGDSDSISTGSVWTHSYCGWGSVESRKSYTCLTTLYADHSHSRNHKEESMDNSCSDEEQILCFRAKRMLICRDVAVVEKSADRSVTPCDNIDSAAWGYFVDTVEEQ